MTVLVLLLSFDQILFFPDETVECQALSQQMCFVLLLCNFDCFGKSSFMIKSWHQHKESGVLCVCAHAYLFMLECVKTFIELFKHVLVLKFGLFMHWLELLLFSCTPVLQYYYWSRLYSSTLCCWANSLCSCHMWFWMSDCIHIYILYPLKWCTNSAVCYMDVATWNCCHFSALSVYTIHLASVYSVTSLEATYVECMCV